MTNQQKANLLDTLLGIEQRYREQAILAQAAVGRFITTDEYLEFVERHKLAREAVEEWQGAWLASLQKRGNEMAIFEAPNVIARSTVVNCLWKLRRELEAGDALTLEASLLLYDVCEALGLDTIETEAVLGFEATRQVEKWKAERVQIAEAAKAVEDLAASD